MAAIDNETKTSNDGGDKITSSKKKHKKSRKRKKLPQPGDPDYKTPTQLRNARKRRKKKQEKVTAGDGVAATKENDPKVTNSSNNDPSLKYLSNPKAAPTVRNAIKFFREKTNTQAGTNHDVYFPVTLGSKLGWRTVARLAVRVRGGKNGDNSNDGSGDSKKLRIGLFVPGSHELLPVPDCPVHNRRINDLIKVLEEECNALNVPALDDDAEGGALDSTDNFGLRYVAIAVERTTQKQQLVLVWKEPLEEQERDDTNNSLDNLVRKLVKLSRDATKKDIRLHSVWVHYNNTWKHSSSIFDRNGRWETKFVDGEKKSSSNNSENDPLFGAIRETMLPIYKPNKKNNNTNSTSINDNEINVPLYFPPQVFRQANLDGFAKIILRIREWLREQQSKDQTSSSSSPAVESMEDPLPQKRKRRRGKRDTSNASQNKQQEEPPNNEDDKAASTRTPSAPARGRTLGHCLELYGGVGTIGLNLVDFFDSLDSSDENPFNEVCFNASADKLKILPDDKNGKSHQATVVLDPSKRAKITYTSKSASEIVVEHYESLKKASVVVVDPPRKGLDPPVIEALCSEYNYGSQSNYGEQQHLVYVSCGFDAFRRDYRALVEHSGKWTLDRAEGHILFPGSDAIETLAFFTRTK